MCHTFQLLVSYRSFIDKQMMFYSFFCISNRKSEFWKELCRILKNSYVGWPRLVVKKKLFSKFSFLVKDTKKIIKHHFLSIKDPYLTKVWRVWHKNWDCHALRKLKIEKGVAGTVFEPRPSNFVKIHNFSRSSNGRKTIFG